MSNNIALYSNTMQGGKSTVAEYLIKYHGYKRLKFAQVLKDMLAVFLNYFVDDPWAYLEGTKKENVIPGLDVTARHLMQTLGDEWGRQCVAEDVWIRVVLQQIQKNPSTLFVVDDLRYPNEYTALAQLGFTFVNLVGHGQLTSEHSSEGSLNGFDWDHTIYNDDTIQNLLNRVETIIF